MLTRVWVWRMLLQQHRRNSLLLFSEVLGQVWGKRQYFLNLDCSSSAIHRGNKVFIHVPQSKRQELWCVLKERCATLTLLCNTVLFQAENTYKTPECKWQHPPLSSTSVLCPPPLCTALICCVSSVTVLWLQVYPLSAMLRSLLKPLMVPAVWTCHKGAAAATTCY